MDSLLGFLASTLVALLIVVTPGSSTAIVIKNSLLRSREEGFATALGIVLGNTFYVTLGLAGIAALVVGSPVLFTFIRYAGAIYMAYLGIRLLFSKKKDYMTGEKLASRDFWTSFREGLFTNLSNPKFLLLLLAFFSQFITAGMPFYLQALAAYQISLFALVWFSILNILLTTSAIRSRISPFLHYVEIAAGVILIAFAVFAFSGA